MSEISLNLLYLNREQGEVRVPDKVSMNFGKTIAARVYRKALEIGIGTMLKYW